MKISGEHSMRPKNKSTSLLEQAQQYGPEAIATLVGIAQNSSNPSAKLAAIKTLLDRGFGKPPQSLLIATEEPAESFSPEELEEAKAEYWAKLRLPPRGRGSG